MRSVWLTLLVVPAASAAAAQEQYRGLPLAPYEIYQAVVGYAADQNFDALHKSLKHMPGLLQALSSHCGKDLESQLETALLARSAADTQSALMEMIFADFSLNLSQAVRAGDKGARRERLEMAYVDLTFLARDANAKVPGTSEATRTGLASLARLGDQGGVEAEARALRERLATAVPHCDIGRAP